MVTLNTGFAVLKSLQQLMAFDDMSSDYVTEERTEEIQVLTLASTVSD